MFVASPFGERHLPIEIRGLPSLDGQVAVRGHRSERVTERSRCQYKWRRGDTSNNLSGEENKLTPKMLSLYTTGVVGISYECTCNIVTFDTARFGGVQTGKPFYSRLGMC